MRHGAKIRSIILSPRGFIITANVVVIMVLCFLGLNAFRALSFAVRGEALDKAFTQILLQRDYSDAQRCAMLQVEAARFSLTPRQPNLYAQTDLFVVGPGQRKIATVRPGPEITEQDPKGIDGARIHELNGKEVAGFWWSGAECDWYFTGVYIDHYDDTVWTSLRYIIWIGLIAVSSNSLIGFIAHRLLKRDLVKVLEDCRMIEEGDLTHEVRSDLNSADFASIASQINSMTGSIRLLVLNLRTISLTLTHDLRNYINFARIRIKKAAKDLDIKENAEMSAALSSLQRLDALATEISRLSVNPGGSLSASVVTRLDGVAKRTLSLFKDSFEDAEMVVEIDLEPSAARVSEALLTEVIANLLGNSIKYASAGKRVSIRTFTEGGKAIVEVSDFGPGIPESELQTVFRLDRRLSRDKEIEGNGFGLAIARLFTVMNGGDLSILPTREHDDLPGATFRLTFMAADQTSRV